MMLHWILVVLAGLLSLCNAAKGDHFRYLSKIDPSLQPDRVRLQDMSSYLELDSSKVQNGFLPQKFLMLLNEMNGDQILRQHLCYNIATSPEDLDPDAVVRYN